MSNQSGHSTGDEDTQALTNHFQPGSTGNLNFCCAWLSLARLIQKIDTFAYGQMVESYNKNPLLYENLSILSGKKAKYTHSKKSLSDVLKTNPFRMQLHKVKKEGTWDDWLKRSVYRVARRKCC